MELEQKHKPSVRENLRKKAPFIFDNLFTALLITYLFLPLTVGENYYQMFGHNQIISVNIDPADASTYLSRLIVYKENTVDDVQVGQRAVFYDQIAGVVLPVDGQVIENEPGKEYFVVESSDHLINDIEDDNYLGTYVRESHILDRFMYFNFRFHWRILTDINAGITVYVFYFVFFKKDVQPQPLPETKTDMKKNKALTKKPY